MKELQKIFSGILIAGKKDSVKENTDWENTSNNRWMFKYNKVYL